MASFSVQLLCVVILGLFVVEHGPVHALDNGLALTPPLGWSSWLALGERDYCDEKTLRDSADAIIETGLAAAGYKTVMISDCWGAVNRSANGKLQAETDRFPSGSLKGVIEYIHSKGLRAGVYQDIGTETCVGHRAGMYGHYESDAQQLALEWNIDWIKIDNCNNRLHPDVLYPQIAKAFNETKRPVLINLCEWGQEDPWKWAPACGNSWRVTGDHMDEFKSTKSIILAQKGRSANYSGAPRHGWNDMDMVFTGLAEQQPPNKRYFPGQTHTEYITEFSMWALLQSPLVWTGDVRNMSAFQRTVLFNFDVLAVHNDTSSKQGDYVMSLDSGDNVQVWRKFVDMERNQALVIVNLGEAVFKSVQVTFESLGLTKTTQAIVTDLWTKDKVTAIGAYPQTSLLSLEPHACIMIKIFPLPL